MIKKVLFLAIMGFLSLSISFSEINEIGSVIYTDIVTEINNKEVESFNINNYTAIYVRDIEKLGFDIKYDSSNRVVNIKQSKILIPNFWKRSLDNKESGNYNVGDKIGSVLYTDIVTKFNNREIESFNINGSTAIYARDLEILGAKVFWDESSRKLIINNLDDAMKVYEYGNLRYSYMTYNEDRIKIVGAEDYVKEVIIPASIKNIPVTAIDNSAFQLSYGLEKVDMPNSITVIGSTAFYYANLKNITIPDSVIKIGDAAFVLNGIEKINFGKSIKIIGERAFYNNRLEPIKVPDTVTEIGRNAFGNLNKDEITLGKGFNSYLIIEDKVLLGQICKIRSDFVIPKEVNKIGAYAFTYKSIEHLVIPSNVKEVENFAFDGAYIKTLEISESVKIIGERAFSGTRIKEVTIPDSVTSIGKEAFLPLLEKDIHLGKGYQSYFDIRDGIIYGHIGETNEILILPENPTRVDDYAFHGTNIRQLIMSDSIRYIGKCAFSDASLNKIKFSNSLIEIGEDAFMNSSLDNIILPVGLETIKRGAFANASVKSVFIPNSVKSIEGYAFSCNQIETLTIPDSIKEIEECTFEENRLIELNIGKSVINISSKAFSENKLISVSIPDNVRSFTSNSFDHYTAIKANIGSRANKYASKYGYIFQDINNTSYKESNEIVLIEKEKLDYEYNDKINGISIKNYKGNDGKIIIPSEIDGVPVKMLDKHAFEGKRLRSVVIPDTVEYIEYGALRYNFLTDIKIPSSVKKIGRSSFKRNYLGSIKIPETVEFVGQFSFVNNNITKVNIPNTSIEVERWAFDAGVIQ